MPVIRGYIFVCGHAGCRVKPLVIYETLLRTDQRTAERMARQEGWLKVANDWYCSAPHATEAYLEAKRARSAKRTPRAVETPEAAHETLAAVAADGRDG